MVTSLMGMHANSLQKRAIIVFCLYGSLTILNFWYLITRIRKLEQKCFHLTMFLLLQICYSSYILEYIIYLTFTNYLAIVLTYNTFYLTNEIVHSIFVIKYWALSKKISSVVQNKEDVHFKFRLWSIIIFQFLLIFVMYLFNIWYGLSLVSLTLLENMLFHFFTIYQYLSWLLFLQLHFGI